MDTNINGQKQFENSFQIGLDEKNSRRVQQNDEILKCTKRW